LRFSVKRSTKKAPGSIATRPTSGGRDEIRPIWRLVAPRPIAHTLMKGVTRFRPMVAKIPLRVLYLILCFISDCDRLAIPHLLF
jgi:hypothetical protein